MKYKTFELLISGLTEQEIEDNHKTNLFEEILRQDVGYIKCVMADKAFESIIEEFDLDDNKINILVDFLYNESLAFKYRGEIYESCILNLYKLFKEDL
jgi:hypothetical protein